MKKLYEAGTHILMHTGYADPVEHRHGAAHIILSMGEEMRVLSGCTEHLCRGVMIPSGVSHVVNTQRTDALVFLFDSTTNVAQQIKAVQCISKERCDDIIELYGIMEQACTTDRYRRFEQALLMQLDLPAQAFCVRDERVASAINYIRSNSTEQLSCQQVADAVHLSQGRFSHLFKEQVGMTFSAYLIYQRIMHAYAQILQGTSITDAALGAGFASSAHFSDVNRRIFGISASAITHNLAFIKIE